MLSGPIENLGDFTSRYRPPHGECRDLYHVVARRSADLIQCQHAPVTHHQVGLPTGVYARLWLRGDWLGLRNALTYLWLHPDDGRALAFRLPAVAFENDQAIGELVEQVAEDLTNARGRGRARSRRCAVLSMLPATSNSPLARSKRSFRYW